MTTREWSVPESAKLGDVIAVAIRAVIAVADNRVDIESFGSAKIDWFETFLELPNGIPSHDAFGRVFSLIDARNLAKVREVAEIEVAAKRKRAGWDLENLRTILRLAQ